LASYGLYNYNSSQSSAPTIYADRLAQIAEEVNSMNTTWKASVPSKFQLLKTENEMKFFLGSNIKTGERKERYNAKRKTYGTENLKSLPENFDSRDQWSGCDSIKEIQDQSDCGSCWAVSSASAMSDRICIGQYNNHEARNKLRISASDINSCCTGWCGSGCDGGEEDLAHEMWVSRGFVTGAEYGNNDYCISYPFAPCAHHVNVPGMKKCGGPEYHAPACRHRCTNDSYSKSYDQDIVKGSSYNTFTGESDMMQEIHANGPLVIGFTVYEDFPTYKSGVYHHVSGSALGGHAVRVIGWGVEDGAKYWLVANSWNNHWGDQGLFRIRRGVNECNFESDAVSGTYDA